MTEWMQELTLLLDAEYHARRIVATLATVHLDGSPQARTVFVRWFDEDNDSIWITTDSRSAKVAQLEARPMAELVLWTPHERQQFRVRGAVEIVRSGEIRADMWTDLSDNARALFFGPPPGEPRRPDERFIDVVSSDVPPPETFVLLALRPVEVEALELNEFPHRRRRWKRANRWQVEMINP